MVEQDEIVAALEVEPDRRGVGVIDMKPVRGGGVGRALLDSFLEAMDTAGVWTVQSSIFPENHASLALHERAGFRRVGQRERIALMTYGPWAGKWRDTVLIERRRADG